MGQEVTYQAIAPYRGGGNAPALGMLTADGRIFRMDGQPWRYGGASAFNLCDRYGRGQDIDGFCSDVAGFPVLRTWSYTPVKDWGSSAWESPSLDTLVAFLKTCADRGRLVEFTLLTDDDPARLDPAARLVDGLRAARPRNLILEIGNEPETHKAINTAALRDVCERSGFLYASGNYENSAHAFGSYLVTHTGRDSEWPRRAHDLLEFYTGGGPNAPSDPAHHCPIVADEPIRPDQAGYNVQDFRAYFGACALLGAGATFHCESGKLCGRLTAAELACADAAMEGLRPFPADAPLGPYRRIDEQGGTLRTYAVGNYMVRIRPTMPQAPEPGWTAIDADGILWRR